MAGDQFFELFHHGAAAGLGAVAVHHHGKRIDRFIVDQHRHFHQKILAVAGDGVVKAGVALGDRFQPVIEIEHHFVERQIIHHHGACARVGKV